MRVTDQLGAAEAVLLEAAQTLEFRDFRVVTSRWEQLADADGASQAHECAHDDRDARCDFDGAVFRFETARRVIQGTSRDVFDAFCQAEFDRDWHWVKETDGNEAEASLLPRTVKQRRADAFAAMILAAATAQASSLPPAAGASCSPVPYERSSRRSIRSADWIGCNLRAQIAAIDHLEPRSRGGPADVRNGKIMCDKHNIFEHTAGYRVECLPDGTIAITRPDGTRLRPPDAAEKGRGAPRWRCGSSDAECVPIQ